MISLKKYVVNIFQFFYYGNLLRIRYFVTSWKEKKLNMILNFFLTVHYHIFSKLSSYFMSYLSKYKIYLNN
jgi:hypothetical protein